jgi:hypothetical protein
VRAQVQGVTGRIGFFLEVARLERDARDAVGLLSVLLSFDWRMEPVRREIAAIAYHFHWGREECLALSRSERRAWLSEIDRIHKEISRSMKRKGR